MIHLGDVSKINGFDIAPVDIITFGAPCQDISVAGGRKGIQHSEHGDEETTRSGLFYEALRIIKEMRDNDVRNGRANELLRPRYAIYENVGGLTSSNEGRDFQKVLTEFVRLVEPDAPEIPMPEEGKWPNTDYLYGVGANGRPFSVAWRQHDAQWWGVPQRRKRYCVLMDLNGLTAPTILLDAQLGRNPACAEPDEAVADTGAEPRPEVSTLGAGLPRDTESCGSPRESAAAGAEGGAGGASSYTLKIRGGVERDSNGRKAGKGPLVQEERSATIGVSQDQTLIQAYGIGSYDSNGMKSTNPYSGIYKADTTRTLDLNGGSPACNQGGIAVVYPLEGNGQRGSHFGNGYGSANDPSFTLNTVEHHGVAFGIDQQGGKGGANYAENIGPPILSDSHGTPHAVAFTRNQRDEVRNLADVAGSVSAESGTHQTTYVATAVDCRNGTEDPDVNGTLQAKSNGGYNTNSNNIVRTQACDVYNQTVEGDVAPTVTAAAGGTNTSGPKVLTAGFSFGQSANARSLGYEKEKSPTIRGGEGGNQKPVVLQVDEDGTQP